MTNRDDRRKSAATTLREKAEALARKKGAQTPPASVALSPRDIQKTLHELQVHEIELEMQNEELRAAQVEIEAGRARYFDLYDLAPAGYCTLSEHGLILEANLSLATLLETARSSLIKKPLSRFIYKNDQTEYYLYSKKLFESGESLQCDLRLVKPDGALIWVHVRGNTIQSEDGVPVCRLVLVDITGQKAASEELRRHNEDLQLMIAINHAANQNQDIHTIVQTVAAQLRMTFNSHLLSVFIRDEERHELRMYGNSIDRELAQKIEKLIGRPIPQIRLKIDEHPFTALEQCRKGTLAVGKKEVTDRLAGYLRGTAWPVPVQKIVSKLLPALCDLLDYQSSAAVPMISKGETVGYLELGSRTILTDRDLKRIQTIADRFATMVVRHEEQKKLRESEERMSSAFKYAAIGMAFVATNGRWLKVNPVIPTMLGYSETELLAKTFQDVTHPDDLAQDVEYVRQMLAGIIETYQMEKRYIHKSGKIVWVSLSVSLVRDQAGIPLYFISQLQDISDRKLAEQAIIESELKFRTLYETMAQGVVYQDHAGTILHANPSAERILGLNLAQLQGRTSRDEHWHTIHEDGSPFPGNTHPSMMALKTGKKSKAVMGVFNPSKEQYRWINVNAIPEFKMGDVAPYQVFTTFDDITDLKNAFHELGQAKELLECKVAERTRDLTEINNFHQAILDNAPLAIITTDSNGIIKSVNPAGEKLTLYSLGDIINKTNTLFLHDRQEIVNYCLERTGNPDLDDAEIFTTMLLNMLHRTTEWHWIKKDGQRFPINISLTSLIGHDGNHNGYLAMVLDITKEKGSLDALRKSEAENKAIVTALPDLLFKISRDGIYLDYLSRDSAALYAERNFFIGKSIKDTLPVDLAERSLQALNDAFLKQEVVQYEYSLPIGSGDRYFENRIIAISPDQALSIVRDITDEQKAVEELLVKTKELETFFEVVPDLLCITDQHGNFIKVNKLWQDILGYTTVESEQMKYLDFVHPDDVINTMEAISLLRNANNLSVFTNRYRDQQGEYRFIEWKSASLGEYIYSAARDVTERKNLENSLKAALLKEKELNDLKTRFVSMVSHEFRTPLASILASTETLSAYYERLTTEQRASRLQKITEQVGRLSKYVKDMLYLTRLQAKEHPLQPQSFDIAALFRTIIQELGEITGHPSSLTFSTTHLSLEVSLDKEEVRSILENLLNNAIKYSSAQKPVTVELTTHGTELSFTVSDEGIGIPADDIDHLFEPFFRASNSQDIPGTGLGLPIVKEAVERQGGRITVTSALNQGTQFRITLPLCTS